MMSSIEECSIVIRVIKVIPVVRIISRPKDAPHTWQKGRSLT